MPDDVGAIARDAVLLGEVVDELRARGVLGLVERLRRVADVLDADASLVEVEVARVPRGRVLGHELPDAAVRVDDVLDALVRIVLEGGDAGVPVALRVVDDDEFDLELTAPRRALVGAARRDPLGALVFRLVGEHAELLRDVNRERRRKIVRRQHDDLAVARLEPPAAREGGEDLVRVVLAARLVGEAAHLLDRVVPRGEVVRSRAGPGAELREHESAGLEREVGVDPEIELGHARELGAAPERIELAAPELQGTRGGHLVVDVEVEPLRGEGEAVFDLRDGEEEIARHARLGGARRQGARYRARRGRGIDGGRRVGAAAARRQHDETDRPHDSSERGACTLQHGRSTLAAAVPTP